jgi:hypothetical protein
VLEDLDDDALVASLLDGNEQVFTELVERWKLTTTKRARRNGSKPACRPSRAAEAA